MLLYALTIFLSAFLLFQVQPIVAKEILPWFGGSAAVWTTCMLFFQMELLIGYAYAHWSIGKLNPKMQARVHIALLVACVALLPVIPNAGWAPEGTENPTLRILGLLAFTVGLPYLMLSTTGPLLQAWYARTKHGAMPYRLFALSNLGSMLALLSYPPLIEPYLATRNQAWIWSGAFVAFAILCGIAALRSSTHPPLEALPETGSDAIAESAPGMWTKIYWIALAACPSMLMLAVTNHLTQDVASIPFLWILPLTIYLLSFILTFDARGWYKRNVFLVLLAPALGGMAYLQWSEARELEILQTIGLFALGLFVCCMVCHGELAWRKPSPRYLTSFYLMLSIGGAIGGLFVAVVAPYLFTSYFELPVALMFCGALAYLVTLEEPGLTMKQAVFSMSSISLALGIIGLWVFLVRTMTDSVTGYRLVERNFYGSLRVRQSGDPEDWNSYRTLMHGNINHGEQWTHPSRRREPLTYYCSDSGIGRAIRLRQPGVPGKVGVLGLGAGSMAVFGREGDTYRFYEINPLVPPMTRTQFSYLTDTKAKVDVVMGDGRLSLQREEPGNYDLLMMDAFSGDSIPVHLVTREAFELYFRHLKPNGLLVMHISNKYLDLEPVIARIAEDLGKTARVYDTDEDEEGNCFGTTYVLVANSPEIFDQVPLKDFGTPARIDEAVSSWTDDYSNMYRILK